MASVRYSVFDGQLVSEKRDGVTRQYVPDVLGSTVALLDSSQVLTDTFSYWPYGQVGARTGGTPTALIQTELAYTTLFRTRTSRAHEAGGVLTTFIWDGQD